MFDILVLIVLGVSAVIGLARGATRELVGVVSFLLAVVIAIFSLRYSAPVALSIVKTVWLAKALCLLAVFVIAYVTLRIIGSGLVKGVQATPLNPLDRVIGLGFGLIRGLVILGVGNIVFTAAMPPENVPDWVSKARLYPLTQLSADALQALAPRGARMADKVTPVLKDAVDAPPAKIPDKLAK